MKQRFLFRADATPNIGTGDLLTLINLSELIKSRYPQSEIYFLTRETESAKSIIQSREIYNCHFFPLNITLEEEECIIKQFILSNNISKVFFEITAYPLSDYDLSWLRVPLIVVDFFGYVPEQADVVLNWDIDANEKYNLSVSEKKFFLGPEYVILPDNFDDQLVENRKYVWPPKNILITMGGNDEYNISKKVLATLISTLSEQHSITVIVGAGYQFSESLKTLILTIKNKLIVHIIQNTNNMFAYYLWSDYAFSAAGVATFELLATKTPCSLIACYKHQIKRSQFYDRLGLATYLGYYQDLEMNHIMIPNKYCNYSSKAVNVGNKINEVIDYVYL